MFLLKIPFWNTDFHFLTTLHFINQENTLQWNLKQNIFYHVSKHISSHYEFFSWNGCENDKYSGKRNVWYQFPSFLTLACIKNVSNVSKTLFWCYKFSLSGMTSSSRVLTNYTSNANYCVISNRLDFNGLVAKKVMTIQIFASILKILIRLLVHDKDSEWKRWLEICLR